MNDAELVLAFFRYVSDPSIATADAVAVALEGRPDMPITPDQCRKVLVDNIGEIKVASAGTAAAQMATLMQKLTGGTP